MPTHTSWIRRVPWAHYVYICGTTHEGLGTAHECLGTTCEHLGMTHECLGMTQPQPLATFGTCDHTRLRAITPITHDYT